MFNFKPIAPNTLTMVLKWSLGANLALVGIVGYGLYNRTPLAIGITGPYVITQPVLHEIVDKTLDDAATLAQMSQLPRPMDRSIYDPLIARIENDMPTRNQDMIGQIVRSLKDFADMYEETCLHFTPPGAPSKTVQAHQIAETLRHGAKKLEQIGMKR